MPLTSEQYQLVMRVINERQLTAEREALERREETYRQIPDLKKVKDDVTAAGVTASKKFMAGDTGAREVFDRIRRTAAEMEATLLSAAGLPADYLEPHYTCSDCGDTGYTDDGKPCHCFTQLAYDIIYSQDRLRYWMKEHSFEKFDLSLYSREETDPLTGLTCYQGAVNAANTAAAFVRELTGRPVSASPSLSAVLTDEKATQGNLVIYGSTGTGKTYLTHCIAGEVMKAGKTVIYLTAAEFFDIAEKAEFRHEKSDYENAFAADLLIIDDLGTELVNQFTASVVYRVINERLLNRKHTVISTNLLPAEIRTTYSDRTFSRISGSYSFIKLVGPDLRVET